MSENNILTVEETKLAILQTFCRDIPSDAEKSLRKSRPFVEQSGGQIVKPAERIGVMAVKHFDDLIEDAIRDLKVTHVFACGTCSDDQIERLRTAGKIVTIDINDEE